MNRKIKLLVMAVLIAALVASLAGSVVAASGPNNSGSGIYCGQGAGFGGQNNNTDVICGLLGITPDKLQSQRQEGKSIVQIAAEKGFSEEQVVEAIMAERKAEIQSRIDEGTLTQERANIMLQQMEQNIIRSINRVTVGRPEWAATNGNGYQAGFNSGGSGNMHRWVGTSR